MAADAAVTVTGKRLAAVVPRSYFRQPKNINNILEPSRRWGGEVKLHTQMGKVCCLYLRVEPFAALFWALHGIVLAHT